MSEQTDALTFAGRTLLIHVDNGVVYRNTYAPDGTSLNYEAIAGPMTGATEDVRLHSAEVAPGVFVVGWVERSGMTVTHVMNLGAGTVHAFWTYESEAGRVAELHTATIEST